MEKTFKITCPTCQSIIIIDRYTGEIIETREPLIKKSTGDRFNDAFSKLKDDKKGAEDKFNLLQEAEKNKKQHLEDLFNKGIDEVKKGGKIEKEIRDIDLD